MTRLLACLLLLQSATMSWAAVHIGPEFPISEIAYGRAAGYQNSSALGTNGEQFVAIWSDSRSGHLRVSRITTEGHVLDPFGIEVPDQEMWGRAEVFWTGSHYLIASITMDEIRLIRFSSDGSFPEDRAHVLFQKSGIGYPGLAWNGEQFAVVWNSGTEILLNLYSSDLQPIATEVRISSLRQGNGIDPLIGTNGSDFLVVWSQPFEDWKTLAIRVRNSGEVADSTPLILSNRYSSSAAIGSNGMDFLVAWPDPAVRILAIPRVGSPAAEPAALLEYQGVGDVVWTGSSYFVPLLTSGVNSAPDLYAANVSAEGEPLRIADLSRSPGIQSGAQAALAKGRMLVIWNEHPRNTGPSDLIGGVFDPHTGATLGPHFVVAWGAQRQEAPALAHDGSNYLAAWTETNGNQKVIRFGRLTTSGNPLDGGGFAVREPGPEFDQLSPRVSFDGRNFVIIWIERNAVNHLEPAKLFASRISTDGRLVDGEPILISDGLLSGSSSLAIASDGLDSLVVFVKPGERNIEIRASNLTRDGVVSPTGGTPISQTKERAHSPSLAWSGAHYLVVWQEDILIPGNCYRCLTFDENVVGRRMLRADLPLDAAVIPISIRGDDDEYGPQVAWGAGRFLVAWTTRKGGYAMHARRFDSGGNVLDLNDILIARTSFVFQSTLTFDGMSFLSGWSELGGASFRRITPEGTLLDRNPILLTSPPHVELLPLPQGPPLALSGFARGQSIAIYGRPYPDPGFEVMRLTGRSIQQNVDLSRERAIRR